VEGKVGSVPAFLLFSGLVPAHRATVISQRQSINFSHRDIVIADAGSNIASNGFGLECRPGVR
jgi:hypothetical protein